MKECSRQVKTFGEEVETEEQNSDRMINWGVQTTWTTLLSQLPLLVWHCDLISGSELLSLTKQSCKKLT